MGFIKEAGIQIASGGSAGLVEICMNHPLDIVKTRLQLQKVYVPNDPHSYRSVPDCLMKIARSEGVRSLYKGILPPIMVETPKRALKFFNFEQLKKLFLFGSPTATPLTFTLAGFGSGVIEGIIVNPFEVIKITLQSNVSHSSVMPGTWSVASHIIKTGGFGADGLCKGLMATIARHAYWNMVYFAFYHTVKSYIPHHEDGRVELARRFGIGLIAGTLASCVNIPFDVAKSRIQGPQPVPGEVKYRGCTKAILTIAKEEGVPALYKGLVPKLMRLGPGGAIMLVVYDYTYAYLKTTFPD